MGYEDCVAKVVKAGKGTVDPAEAEKMIEGVVKKITAGVTEDQLFQELFQITDPKAKESRILLKKFNKMQTQRLRDKAVNHALNRIKEVQSDTILSKVLQSLGIDNQFGRIRESVLYYARALESYHQVTVNQFKQAIDTELKLKNLLDIAKTQDNDLDIIDEMANLNNNGTKSITGNEQAFEIAKIYRDTLKTAFDRKVAGGSTIQFLRGYITSNLWSEFKISAMADDEFFNLISEVEDVKKRGLTREDILELKRKVSTRNYIDPESLDDPLPSDFTRITGGNLADLSGARRSIHLTTDEYKRLAPLLFEGDNMFERVNQQVVRDAATVAKLETLGENPRNQFKRIIEGIKVATQDDPEAYKNGIHALDNNFFLGDRKEDGVLFKALFGDINQAVGDTRFLNTSELLRDLKSTSSLSGAAITAFADGANTALRVTMLEGQQNAGDISKNLMRLYANEVKQFGPVQANASLKAEMAGVMTYFDHLYDSNRFNDPGLANSVDGRLKKTRGVVRKIGQLNQLENKTNLALRANYTMLSSMAHSFKNLEFDKLTQEFRLLLSDSDINAQEWDFIRKFAVDKDRSGNGLLTMAKLKDLDIEQFRELMPNARSTRSLQKVKDILASKWNATLWREARTGVLMPDVVDRARTTRGLKRGTLAGEAARHMFLFKSFSFGLMGRIMMPLLKRGKLTTVAETAAHMTIMAMGIFWAKDLLSGKTPRDFRKPNNMLGLAGFVAGMPYFDALTYALSTDNPSASDLSDVLIGPVGSDALQTGARILEVIKDIGRGKDPELAKEFVRTFMPYLPTRSFPILSIGHNLGYNNLMELLSPGYIDKAQDRAEEHGQYDSTAVQL